MRAAGRALALVALVAVASLTAGTGAFSTVAADRPAAVVVASDLDGAVVGLTPGEGPTGAFATDADGDGTLALELAGDASGVPGAGPNARAVTTLRRVFAITNRGAAPVGVWVTDDGADAVRFLATADGRSLESRANARTLRPGDRLAVTVVVDATDVPPARTLCSRVTVHADAAAGGGA
ncbi:MAG: hypothetical protein ABEJ70_04795 [Halobacteriaceae archaeon]